MTKKSNSREILETALQEALTELLKATEARDKFEIEYEIKRARLLFNADVQNFSNQAMRDAQVILMCEEDGSYRKMAELRSFSKMAWYKWTTITELLKSERML